MSTGKDPVAWLRRRIEERLFLARHAIELGNAAEWTEQSSGVLVTGEPTGTDTWHGTWAMGDSSLTRPMEANDPRDTIARCEAELAILDEHVNAGGGLRDPREDRITCDYHVDTCTTCGPYDWPSEDEPPYAYVTTWGDDKDWPTFYPCRTVRLLASGYRHREGYQEAWGPRAATPPAAP